MSVIPGRRNTTYTPADSPASSQREFIGLYIVTAAFFAVFSMSAPLIPLLVSSLTASPGMLGIVMSVSALGSLFAAVPAGALIQKLGVRRPMISAAVLLVIVSLTLAQIPSLLFLFIGLALFEIGKIIMIVAAQSHIAELSGEKDSSLNFGWYGAAGSLGQMIGPPAAGLVIDHFGHLPTWNLMAVSMLVTCLLILLLIRDTHGLRERKNRPATERKKLSLRFTELFRLITSGPSLIAILASFIVLFAMGTRTSFYPVYLKGTGFSATAIGAMLSLRALTSISVRLFMGWMIRKAGGKFRAMIGSMFLLAVGIGMTPFCRNILTLSIDSIAVGIGIGLSLPLSLAVVSGGVAADKRALAMGVRLTGNRLAQFINPLFFGAVSEWSSIATAFFTGGLLLSVVTLPVYFWWKKNPEDTEHGTPQPANA